MNFLDLFDYQFKPLNKMSKAEVIEELDTYRKLWTWMPEELKAWLCRIGYPTRLIRRNFQAEVGTLGTPHFEIQSLDLNCMSEKRDYFKKETTIEVKTVNIKMGDLAGFEFIHSSEVEPFEEPSLEKAEAVPIPDIGD